MAQTTRETRRLGSFSPVPPFRVLNDVGSSWKKHMYVVSTVKKQIEQKKGLPMAQTTHETRRLGSFSPVPPSRVLNDVGSSWKKHIYVVSTVKKQIEQKKGLPMAQTTQEMRHLGPFTSRC